MELFDRRNGEDTGGNKLIKRILLETGAFRLAAITLQAGASTPGSAHDRQVIYFFATGSGRLDIDGETRTVNEGCLAIVPAGATASIAADKRLNVVAVEAGRPDPTAGGKEVSTPRAKRKEGKQEMS